MAKFLGLLCLAMSLIAGAPMASHAQTTSSTLTLRSAVQRALAANPKLTAAERDVGIATGRKIQAAAIPNPEFIIGLDNVLGSGPYRDLRSAETTVQLSQLLELGSKREARIAAGAAAVDSASWERQATRLEVMSETAIALISVLAAHRIQTLDGHVFALERLTPLLQRRVDAGASSPAEVLRSQVAADLVKVERERAKTALAAARRELAIVMGDTSANFGTAAGSIFFTRDQGMSWALWVPTTKCPFCERSIDDPKTAKRAIRLHCFCWTSAHCGACVDAMDPNILEATLKLHIKEMRERFGQAAGIASDAEACAEAGNLDKSIEIALDVEQLIYEVSTFLNAASMMHRIGKS